ncbi:TPM domain-containing protein [Staphylococcus simulans]|uniref:TPM domain-containing protein n=1 Tax=Staphylococcus simulans TaxID=1286 RepID=UPI001E5B72F9|nr:TPM domain-containing protein [Staphylococcus simulans]MCD8915418.1 TPM domain-containing protein [Staphylococcus simulans]
MAAVPAAAEVLAVVSKNILRVLMITFVLGMGTMYIASSETEYKPLPMLNEDHIYVQDNAHILTRDQINHLQKHSSENRYNYDLMVVTEKDLEGSKPEKYAKRIYEAYQLGLYHSGDSTEPINAAVILFNEASPDSVTIYADQQLKHYFTKRKTKALVKQTAEEAFENKQYGQGLVRLYDKVEEEIPVGIDKVEEKGHTLPKFEYRNEPTAAEKLSAAFWGFIRNGTWFGAITGTLILLTSFLSSGKGKAKEEKQDTHSRLKRMRKLSKKRAKLREKRNEERKESGKLHGSDKKYPNSMRNYK